MNPPLILSSTILIHNIIFDVNLLKFYSFSFILIIFTGDFIILVVKTMQLLTLLTFTHTNIPIFCSNKILLTFSVFDYRFSGIKVYFI